MDKELDKEPLGEKPGESQSRNNDQTGHPDDIIHEVTGREYKYGITSDIDTDIIPVGLDEDVIRPLTAP